VAQIFIYSGLIFMAGKLLPNLLTPVYHLVPTPSSRLLFSSLTVMLIGNYFFQYLYSAQPVLIAGIISTVTGITIVSVGGLIIEQKMPNILMVIGVMCSSQGRLFAYTLGAGSEVWRVRIESSFRGRGQLLPSASAGREMQSVRRGTGARGPQSACAAAEAKLASPDGLLPTDQKIRALTIDLTRALR